MRSINGVYTFPNSITSRGSVVAMVAHKAAFDAGEIERLVIPTAYQLLRHLTNEISHFGLRGTQEVQKQA